MQSNNIQEVRFKRDQINEVLVSYLRTVCKKSFFEQIGDDLSEEMKA